MRKAQKSEKKSITREMVIANWMGRSMVYSFMPSFEKSVYGFERAVAKRNAETTFSGFYYTRMYMQLIAHFLYMSMLVGWLPAFALMEGSDQLPT